MHDCSKPLASPAPLLTDEELATALNAPPAKESDDDLADRWGIGQPNSPREVRLSTGVIRNGNNFVGRAGL